MAYDLVIKNGIVIDGKGGPRFHADVAAHNGRIAAIGKIDETADCTIDATGKIVCPGFVDPHTHYDAQITWDPLLSSSSEHGITTVVMGNCGVGIAPCKPPARALLTEDLVTVEGIDQEVLTAGIRWDWETFPQYIDAAEKRGSALNLAFLVPIAPLRTYVLGDDANERAATAAETQTIAGLLRDAMHAGAWGFSTTASRQQAIKRITSEPASFFGFKDRGRLEKGTAADIVVFDASRIGSPLRPTPINDLPAGGTRLYSKAEGISQVVVNGRILYQEGKHTGTISGEILRSR